MSRLLLSITLLVPLSATFARAQTTAPSTQPSIPESIDRGVKFLEKFQNPDGSWGTGTETRGTEIMSMVPGSMDAFRLGASSLCVMALREVGEKSAHDKGLEYLLTAKDAKRDDGTLLYNTWAHIYMVQAMAEEMLAGNKDPRVVEVAKRNLKEMEDYATYIGGWGYYDFDSHTQPSSMGPTSFGTAAGLVTLFEAKQAGLEVPDKMVKSALHRLEECRLPNGVFLYGSDYKYIPQLRANRPEGAVGRTQPANYALHLWKSKEVNSERVNAGLDLFFKDHKFLDMGRKRPFPHESWYQTSGYYYYFDHYYASRLLEAVDSNDAKAEYAKQIAANVLPHQEEDGSWWDYAMWDFHKPYGTAFAIMTLLRCENRLFNVDRDANSVIFVADGSGSMVNKMPALKRELSKAIGALRVEQYFNVVLAADTDTEPRLKIFSENELLVKATPDAKERAQIFLDGINCGGANCGNWAVESSLKKWHPALICYVTDGGLFDEDALQTIRKQNANQRTRINSTLFVDDGVERKRYSADTSDDNLERAMARLAKENGGKFNWVQLDSLDSK